MSKTRTRNNNSSRKAHSGTFSWGNLRTGLPTANSLPFGDWVQTRATEGTERIPRTDVKPAKPTRSVQQTLDAHVQRKRAKRLPAQLNKATERWDHVLKLASSAVLKEDTEWFDKASLALPPAKRGAKKKAKRSKSSPVAYQRPRVINSDLVRTLQEIASMTTAAGPEVSKKKTKRKKPGSNVRFNRRVYYQTKHWQEDFSTWFFHGPDNFVSAMEKSMVTIKPTGKNAGHASNSQCSRCRRRMAKGNNTKYQLSSYATYSCDCTGKAAHHCTRCMLLEYLIKARKKHGDFIIRDPDTDDAIGFLEIPCWGKCGKDWSPATLSIIGPPESPAKN